jgi:DNA primase
MTTVAGDSPKYINSPETSIYHKGELLYGFSFAKQRIKQENNCYLVEGYTDVLAFHHMVGWEQVVASAGTSLTEAQMGYLFRFTTKITLVFDGDQAGIRAALRGIDKLLAKGFEVKIILLPPGEDPDSYLRKIGAAAFIHYLNHAIQDFITFKAGFLLNHTSEQHPVEQAQCIRDIVRSIVAIPDEITRSLFLKKCSKLFSIEEALLLSTYHELCNQATSTPLLQQKRSFIKRHGTGNHSPYVDHRKLHFINKLTTSIEAYEQEIMRIVLTYGCVKLSEEQYLYEYMFLELGDIAFRSANCIMLFDYFKKVLQLGGTVDIQCCLDGMDEAIKKIAIDLMASPHEISEAWVKKYGIYTVGEIDNVYQMSLEVILRLKIRLVQELIEQNREELTKELTLEAEEHLLQVHQSLKASECSIAKRLGTVVAQ